MQNLLVVDFQYRHEGFLRHFNAADLLHPFLTFLLLLKEFRLRRCHRRNTWQERFAHRFNRFTGNNLGTDRSLNRHFEHLTRNQLARSRKSPVRGDKHGPCAR